jgi:PAS domain S-box-containing protein
MQPRASHAHETRSQVRKVELDLTRQLAELETIYRSAPVGLCHLDTDLRFIRINERLAAMMGRPAADVVGHSLREVLPDLAAIFETLCRQVIDGGSPVLDYEVRDTARGLPYWLVSFFPVFADGDKAVGINTVVRDLNEIRQAEEAPLRLAAIVESSDDAIIGKDLQGIITDWNAGARRIFGYTAEEMIGRSVTLLIPPERLDEEALILSKLRCGERLEHFETVRIRKDGKRIDVSLTTSPIKDPQGRIIGASKIARDITERKMTDAVLKDSEERYRLLSQSLRDADLRKDEFLAMLAHELRNPLATVLFAVEALRLFPADDPAFIDSRRIITERVQHISHLLDDLLDVSRITRGKIQLRKAVLNLNTVISKVVEQIRPRVLERSQELTVSLIGQPLQVEADPTRMEQVFSNLLSNAVKYTSRGGKIWVSNSRISDEVEVIVKDSGVGIASDLLPRIFDPFVQGQQALDRSQGGLGIGLTLVKSLVEMHGGTVAVCSGGPGKGAEFRVRLPLVIERKTAEDEKAGRRAYVARSRRILVVEDNVDSAMLLAQILKMKGHEVEVAHDGQAGIEAARAQGPDIVLLDIGLPGMDGYEVARSIRSDRKTRNARLVALTGYGQEEDRRRSREAGFDDHLVKPVDPQVLEELLASLPKA